MIKNIFWKIRWKHLAGKNKIEATARDVSEKIFFSIMNDIIKKMDFNRKDIVLDIGCGYGELLRMVSKKIRSGIGIDMIKNMIKIAKKNAAGTKNIKFIVGDMRKLSTFKDNTFTKVISYSTFHYLNNKKEAFNVLKQIKRISKKNAIALIGDVPDKNIKKPTSVKRIVHLRYNKKELLDMVSKLDGKARIIEQPPYLPYSTERFDLIIRFN